MDSKITEKLGPVMRTMELLSGRWKIIIMTTLYLGGKMRFNEIKKSIPRITSRALSSDLKYLEENEIVSRSVTNSTPVLVEYELTEYGATLDSVFQALTEWGLTHQDKIKNHSN